jgi:hypothetical protein
VHAEVCGHCLLPRQGKVVEKVLDILIGIGYFCVLVMILHNIADLQAPWLQVFAAVIAIVCICCLIYLIKFKDKS